MYDSTSGRTGSHHDGHPSRLWDYTMIQMEPRYYLFPSDGIEVDSLLLSDFRLLFKMYSAHCKSEWELKLPSFFFIIRSNHLVKQHYNKLSFSLQAVMFCCFPFTFILIPCQFLGIMWISLSHSLFFLLELFIKRSWKMLALGQKKD